MIWFYILIFFISWALLILSSKWMTESLIRIARFLGWKEFVVAFFTIAFGASLPNLFVGIMSAVNKIPELSLGDVLGANIFDLTVVVALTAFISRRGLSAPSRTVQGSSIFTIGSALLPLLLISDGELSGSDGLILLTMFAVYVYWLFKEEERFKKVYDEIPKIKSWKFFLKDIGVLLINITLLLIGARGIVYSLDVFAKALNFPIIFIGIFLLGVSDCIPETSFSLRVAREGQDWMILGKLMGSVMITATLVLGIVALIHPIVVTDLVIKTSFAIGRLFLSIAAILFFVFLRTGKKITRKEALVLLLIYLLFIVAQVLSLKK